MRRTVCVFTYHYSFDSPSSFSLLPFSMAPLPTLQRQPRSVQHHGQSFDCNLPSSTATTSREIRQIAPKITITFKTHSHHFLHTTTIATPSLRDLIPSPSFLEAHRTPSLSISSPHTTIILSCQYHRNTQHYHPLSTIVVYSNLPC